MILIVLIPFLIGLSTAVGLTIGSIKLWGIPDSMTKGLLIYMLYALIGTSVTVLFAL